MTVQTANSSAGCVGSTGCVGSPETPHIEPPLDDVREWLSRFVIPLDESDLDILALWAVHTHVCEETYTTPRLIIDSSQPGSGKTTVLEHLQRLTVRPVQAASLTSSALIARMLDTGLRTFLIDEVDRSLDPKRETTTDLIAVLNSGYKRGATRPVLVSNGNGYDAKEMPTFCPVAMAGNSPNLPDDTRSRSIRILLMPDLDGLAEESDWELIEPDAEALGERIAQWCNHIRDSIGERPTLPENVKGRARERWSPLKRVAIAAGGKWPDLVDEMARKDVIRVEQEREDGVIRTRPHIVLLNDIVECWKSDETFVETSVLIDRLVRLNPEMWGDGSDYGRRLTAQRMGRMLSQNYRVSSSRMGHASRGYRLSDLVPVLRRSGMPLPGEPTQPVEPTQPATGEWNNRPLDEDGFFADLPVRDDV